MNAEEVVLTGVAKVAALLLAMSKPSAARILKHFDEDEIKIVAQAATDLGMISKEVVDGLIEELAYDLKHGVDLTATTEKIQGLLEGVLTPEQIAALMAQTRTKSAHAVWQHLREIPDVMLTQYLANEHHQVLALVLSRAEPTTAAALLKMLPKEMTQKVVSRMLSLRPVAERPLVLLEISFLQDLLVNRGRDAGATPHTRLAEVINKMDRKLMDESLNAIAAHNEKDAELVRQQLFTYNDLVKLTPAGLVTVFDTIPPETVVKALYGTQKALRTQILEAIPSRSRRAIEAELENGPNPRTRDVAKAQRVIADLALEMLERGVIELKDEDAEGDE